MKCSGRGLGGKDKGLVHYNGADTMSPDILATKLWKIWEIYVVFDWPLLTQMSIDKNEPVRINGL